MSTPQKTADIATGVSVAAAGTSWIAQANEILSFIGTIVAILAGVGALVVYYFNIKDKFKKN
jgi:hypothetical protein